MIFLVISKKVPLGYYKAIHSAMKKCPSNKRALLRKKQSSK
jgi:hypothetical protein